MALSQALTRDFSVLSESAVSFPIETEWNNAVTERSGSDWHCDVWPTNQMAVVSLPHSIGLYSRGFGKQCQNRRMGKIYRLGYDVFDDLSAKNVLRLSKRKNRGGECHRSGSGRSLYSNLCATFHDLKSASSRKIAKMARAVMRGSVTANESITVNYDFDTSTPPAPDATSITGISAWGTGVWGADVWGASTTLATQENWQSVSGSGFALAPCLQITSGSSIPIDTQIVRIDMTYDVGDVAT